MNLNLGPLPPTGGPAGDLPAHLNAGMDRLRVATEQSLELAPQDAAEWLADHVSSGADDVALIVADIVAPS